MRIEPASALTLKELTALWNRGYADYFVPLEYTPERLQRHIMAYDISLEHSVVLSSDREHVALSLLGIRGARAWIGGFGVVPEWRRRGHATHLIDAQLHVADQHSLDTIQLEVLVQNWARTAYERAGFAIARRLGVFSGTIAHREARRAVAEVPLETAVTYLAASHASVQPCWQREGASLTAFPADRLHSYVLGSQRRPLGALVCQAMPDTPLRVHDVAGDENAVHALLCHATATLETPEVLLVNEPDGTPTHRLLRRIGVAEVQAQWEMCRLRPRDASRDA